MNNQFLQRIKLLFLFIAFAWAFSCTKEEVSQESSIASHTIMQDTVLTDTSYYTDVTIDGARTFYISGQNGSGMYYGGSGARYSGITNNFNTRDSDGYYYNINYIEFNKYESPELYGAISNYSVATFNRWLTNNYAIGDYDYFDKNNSLTEKNGIVLVWTDKNGTKWQTNFGDQTGSSFKIIKSETWQGQNSGYITSISITAVFNCKLYDNNGNVKLLTNGRLRLALWI
ncbi:MAG: hypothetical protein JST96_11020 [Bacteroidetes bacterium]|nr:hypothetical protein [Bacteroidota bacterium]